MTLSSEAETAERQPISTLIRLGWTGCCGRVFIRGWWWRWASRGSSTAGNHRCERRGGHLQKKNTLDMSARAVGDIASVYLIGEVVGCPGLRPAVRQARSAAPLLGHPRRLPRRLGSHGCHLRARHRVGDLAVCHPFRRRHGHRGRVRRHQLGHRRDDPGALPRPCRHRHQRYLLGRGPARHARRARDPQHLSDTVSWRIGFLLGPCSP